MDAHVDSGAAPDEPLTFGHFRFAHAETLIPLIALLELFDSSNLPTLQDYAQGGAYAHTGRTAWSSTGAVVAPMACNIAMLLYRCGGLGNGDEWKVC